MSVKTLKKPKFKNVLLNGIAGENPVFRLVLGTCPTIALSTTATNGIGMGLAVTFVLIGSNAVISLLRAFIPDKVRIPAFVIVISTFVTVVNMLMHAFLPALYESLGVFIPLIVVNCIILARAEAFAYKNGVVASVVDGLGMGVGFTLGITVIAIIREVVGKGEIFGTPIFGENFMGMSAIAQSPGGFIVFGLVLGAVNFISQRRARRRGEPK